MMMMILNIPYGIFIDSKPVIQGMLAHSPVKLITTGEVKNSTVVLVIRNKSEIKEAHEYQHQDTLALR